MSREAWLRLAAVLRQLGEAGIHTQVMPTHREDAAYSLLAAVPGERWEIDLMADGTVEFERFASAGGVTGEADLTAAVARFAEPAEVKGGGG